MAPLPVIGDTYRVTLNWSQYQGVTPRTVLHILSPSGDEQDVADALGANFTDAMWGFMHSSFTTDTLDIIKLDGSSPTNTYVVSSYGGTTSGDMAPPSAAVVGKHTGQRGPRGRGRSFIGPIVEGGVTNGLIVSPSAYATAWQDFQDALVANSPSMAECVASYVHAVANTVTSYHVRDAAGTLRRRQNQLV